MSREKRKKLIPKKEPLDYLSKLFSPTLKNGIYNIYDDIRFSSDLGRDSDFYIFKDNMKCMDFYGLSPGMGKDPFRHILDDKQGIRVDVRDASADFHPHGSTAWIHDKMISLMDCDVDLDDVLNLKVNLIDDQGKKLKEFDFTTSQNLMDLLMEQKANNDVALSLQMYDLDYDDIFEMLIKNTPNHLMKNISDLNDNSSWLRGLISKDNIRFMRHRREPFYHTEYDAPDNHVILVGNYNKESSEIDINLMDLIRDPEYLSRVTSFQVLEYDNDFMKKVLDPICNTFNKVFMLNGYSEFIDKQAYDDLSGRVCKEEGRKDLFELVLKNIIHWDSEDSNIKTKDLMDNLRFYDRQCDEIGLFISDKLSELNVLIDSDRLDERNLEEDSDDQGVRRVITLKWRDLKIPNKRGKFGSEEKSVLFLTPLYRGSDFTSNLFKMISDKTKFLDDDLYHLHDFHDNKLDLVGLKTELKYLGLKPGDMMAYNIWGDFHIKNYLHYDYPLYELERDGHRTFLHSMVDFFEIEIRDMINRSDELKMFKAEKVTCKPFDLGFWRGQEQKYQRYIDMNLIYELTDDYNLKITDESKSKFKDHFFSDEFMAVNLDCSVRLGYDKSLAGSLDLQEWIFTELLEPDSRLSFIADDLSSGENLSWLGDDWIDNANGKLSYEFSGRRNKGSYISAVKWLEDKIIDGMFKPMK